jgi:hypothetical protein
MRILLAFLIIAQIKVHAQFSGKVTYQEAYRSKTPSIPVAAFEKFVGTKREFYTQGAFYKSVHSGELKSVIMYRGDVNKAYRFNEGADTIFWLDASRDTLSRVSNPKVEDSNEIILGLKCKKITIKSQVGTTTYYFNSTYSIDPADFKNHHVEYWDFYTATTKSVPLKIIFEGTEMGFTSTAVKIEPMKLTDDIFKVPPGYLKKLF